MSSGIRPDAPTIKRASAELKKAGKMKAGTTEREARLHPGAEAFYSNSKKADHGARAMAYSVAMEKVYRKYRDDHEAAAFMRSRCWQPKPDNDTTFANSQGSWRGSEKLVRG